MAESIQPLRINKGTPSSSPVKSNGMSPRPLSEINPSERRRNSPSFNQATKSFLDSSPFDSSPFASKFNGSPFSPGSKLAYWQSRDATSPTCQSIENRDPRDASPAPAKRNSIENLKRASRVKNSSMFAREQKQEYDPASAPLVERPLAAGRTLNQQQGTLWGKPSDVRKSDSLKSPPASPAKVGSPTAAPSAEIQKLAMQTQASPTKSSLSKNSRYGHSFDPENGVWSEDEDNSSRELPPGKVLHRHPKSVTFDVAPPQVNEYEMTTPDPSSVASGSREGSYDSIEGEDEDEDEDVDFRSSGGPDDSFDASLEDTDKTPVVLPEDWRFMSPDRANDDLAATFDDPFETRKPSPTENIPAQNEDARPPTRTDSRASNGESRPLPPLPPPPALGVVRERTASNSSLQATAERVASFQRNLPTPPRPASISKSELQGMGSSAMSLEDRLKLMMLQEEEKSPSGKTQAEEQRERRMRRAGSSPDRALESKKSGFKIHEDPMDANDDEDLDIQLPPMIKRESILRKIKRQNNPEEDCSYSSPAASSSPGRVVFPEPLDPDVPIPSLEERPRPAVVADDGKIIKQEDEESEVDQYAIPEMYRHGLASPTESNSHSRYGDDDDESHYSTDSNGLPGAQPSFAPEEEDAPPTPRASEALPFASSNEKKQEHRMSLSQFAAMLGRDDFSESFSNYMTPSPPMQEPTKREKSRAAPPTTVPPLNFERPITPVEQVESQAFGYMDEDRASTPDSVIRHPIADHSDEEEPEEPVVPEPTATIKAPGGRLKTRPSLAPADMQAMAETRRKVSGDRPQIPPVPEKHHNRPSVIMEADSFLGDDQQFEAEDGKQPKRKSSLIQLEVPVDSVDDRLSIGIDKEFDRLLEAQKVAFSHFIQKEDSTKRQLSFEEDPERLFNFANLTCRKQKGYLMRQNTKLVVASSGSHDSSKDETEAPKAQPRTIKSAGNSPVKGSATWTTEPWNGRIRRKSIRQSGGSPMKRPALPSEPVPPLPGMASNVTSDFDTAAAELEVEAELENFEDGAERGRLFVKVVGVKDLDLPLPRGERSYFCLTLDNGLHCVTTAWLEMGRNAPIGQEFELVVLNDLEFQLTLATKLEEPKPIKVLESPSKLPKVKQSAFSRFLSSPKKRKEQEQKQQEDAQRIARQKQQEADAAKRKQPSAWDLQHKLVNRDGSFGRAYISLKDHERQAYGRPYTVDVPCFNEWAIEEGRTAGSSKSGRSMLNNGMQRKPPYKIGKLELQLLYVPKPKEATDADMPKSMNACVRELQDAERASQSNWEGHLSQQGGDCPYWRRRFFRLEGSKLTAYHEATRQPRATINLAKASKLIDDKSSLVQKEVTGKGGHRRRSAFAAEEEGYMFVEEGWRVRFTNGEVIDFYADSTADKEGWMRALADVVGKDTKSSRSWTEIVLKRERAIAAKAARGAGHASAPNHVAMKSAPNSPAKHQSQQTPRHGHSRSAALSPAPATNGATNGGSPSKVSYSRPFSQLPSLRPNSADKPLPKGCVRDPKTMSEAERRAKSRSMLF